MPDPVTMTDLVSQRQFIGPAVGLQYHVVGDDHGTGGAVEQADGAAERGETMTTSERDIINVASEGWQWPADEPLRSDKLSVPRVDEAEKQRWRELAAEEWRKAHAPSVEEVFAVEVLSPEENRVIETFRQEVRAAEEFEDKKRRDRARFLDNLGRAVHELVLRLEYGYGAHDTDQRALLTVARFLEQMGPGLTRFADQFVRLAQTLQDRAEGRGVASRSDPTIVWLARTH